ncbi:MAG: hypothetical protein IT336_16310 [Thermomicrobiales bacterium]|nr:hypothetical protein [Thermomicrobiales bacterium]
MNRRALLRNAVLTGVGASALDATAGSAEGPAPPDVRIALRFTDVDGGQPSAASFDEAVGIITSRADLLFDVDAELRPIPPDRLVIALTGVEDVETTITVMTTRGFVEIIDPDGVALEIGSLVTTSNGGPPAGSATPVAVGGPVYETIVTSDEIADAFMTTNMADRVVVGFRLDPAGAEKLYAFTSINIGLPMAIVVDNRVVSSPTIFGAISDEGIIEGLDPREVQALVIQLRLKPVKAHIAVERIIVAPHLRTG